MELTVIVASALALCASSTSLHNLPPQWWVCWLNERRLYFHPIDFVCETTFPENGVLEIEDVSLPDGHRRKFDCNVTRVGRENDLRTSRKAARTIESDATLFGARTAALPVSEEALLIALNS